MPTFKVLLLQTLLTVAPPGHSKYSVAPVNCRGDDCEGFRWSSFYAAPVRQETPADGVIRYEAIVDAAVDAAAIELCRDAEGNKRPDCRPDPDFRGDWTMRSALALMFGAAIPESGLREDVQNGRGQSKRPDDVGGEGRGPGGEVCFMQIHPATAWRFVPDLSPKERAAVAATAATREALARTLLGGDPDALVRCFRTGLRMLARAAAHCDWEDRRRAADERRRGINVDFVRPRDWATYSMYGTGQSCIADNHGKTTKRAKTSVAVAKAIDRVARAKASL
jgi:hypothetical protein